MTGATHWVKVFVATGETPHIQINDMTVTHNGRVMLVGDYNGNVDFGRSKTISGSGGFVTRLYP